MEHDINMDLNLFLYKKNKLLSQLAKIKRLQRDRLLLEKLRDDTQPPVWFDEKLFTVQAVHNHQMTGFMQ